MKIKHSGFREYDARWLYPKDIDLEGIEELGKGLGTQVINKTKKTKAGGCLFLQKHNFWGVS